MRVADMRQAAPVLRALLDRRPAAQDIPDLPRQALRDAQATAAAAKASAGAASALALRAQAAVDAAKGGLGAFAGLDARVAAWHADRLRAGSSADRTPLPHDLAAARRARGDCEQGLADAEAAASMLAGESLATAAAAGSADEQVKAAVIGVVRDDARDLVRRLREVEAEAGRLRGAVATYANQWASADEPWKPLPWEVQQVAHDAHHGMIADLAGISWPEMAGRWVAYRQALTCDPDAVAPAVLRP